LLYVHLKFLIASAIDGGLNIRLFFTTAFDEGIIVEQMHSLLLNEKEH